jgi:hypothetical protein
MTKEAVDSSETFVLPTKVYGATFQNTVIKILYRCENLKSHLFKILKTILEFYLTRDLLVLLYIHIHISAIIYTYI